jgi:hypothetical protein
LDDLHRQRQWFARQPPRSVVHRHLEFAVTWDELHRLVVDLNEPDRIFINHIHYFPGEAFPELTSSLWTTEGATIPDTWSCPIIPFKGNTFEGAIMAAAELN